MWGFQITFCNLIASPANILLWPLRWCYQRCTSTWLPRPSKLCFYQVCFFSRAVVSKALFAKISVYTSLFCILCTTLENSFKNLTLFPPRSVYLYWGIWASETQARSTAYGTTTVWKNVLAVLLQYERKAHRHIKCVQKRRHAKWWPLMDHVRRTGNRLAWGTSWYRWGLLPGTLNNQPNCSAIYLFSSIPTTLVQYFLHWNIFYTITMIMLNR